MASSLAWKVYEKDGELIATFRHALHAIALAATINGRKVKFGSWLVWTEGKEHCTGMYTMEAARIMEERVQAKKMAAYDHQHGVGAAAKVLASRTA